MKVLFISFLIFLFIPCCIYSQNLQCDWQPWEKTELKKTYKVDDNMISLKKIVIYSLKIYKKTLSEQDNEICNFIPSCSNFAYDSVMQKGILAGCLLAADRLTRCHPFAFGKYRLIRNKLYDPVKNYDF